MVASMHTLGKRARMVCCILHWLGGALLADGEATQSDDSFTLLTYCCAYHPPIWTWKVASVYRAL
jgi:hypothetical protein